MSEIPFYPNEEDEVYYSLKSVLGLQCCPICGGKDIHRPTLLEINTWYWELPSKSYVMCPRAEGRNFARVSEL